MQPLYDKKIKIMQYKPLKREDISKGLKETIFSEVILLDIASSTNEIAKDLALKGAKGGTLIIAEEQTSGRGRMGRRWFSKKYANLLFSLLLRPEINKEMVFSLNMAIALAFIEAIESLFDIYAMIKWPNDVYVRDKKLAGILTDFFLKKGDIEYVIIGMGINVNWCPDDSTLLYPATSLSKEKGEYINRQLLLIEGLRNFDKYYNEILQNNKVLYEKWNKRCMTIGKEVSIIRSEDEQELRGIAVRIEKDGSLVLLVNGEEKRIFYGDVSLR